MRLALACTATAALGASFYFLWTTFRSNGAFGFPLDDPWIHLQFARNLRDFGSFSYFRGEMVTSGSTAPLYTVLLAAGFLLTSNEMILSYVLGAIAHAALALLTFAVARRLFANDLVPALGAALLVALEPRLVHASVSGMETSLFMALLMGSYFAYLSRRAVWLGVLLGLALWTRPESILFAGMLVADRTVENFLQRRAARGRKARLRPADHSLRITLAVFAVFAGCYVTWNLMLSGTVLPNTYAAKVAYYARGHSAYGSELAAFLSAGPRGLFAALCTVGVAGALVDLVRRSSHDLIVPLGWIILLIAAYGYMLPHLYQEGRYLMPVLPFLVFFGVKGILIFVRWGGRQIRLPSSAVKPAVALVVLVPLGQFSLASAAQATSYAEMTKYIADRQVRTARWIAEHLPADAVVGTHDIGAIGYYSGRRVVDMVGLVSPEMIRHIGRLDGLLTFLSAQHVTHLAVLRNWFEIANQTPLFQTVEAVPEVMEVFPFLRYRTKFVSYDASRAMELAGAFLRGGRAEQASGMLEQVLRVEPACARAHFLAGLAASALGHPDRAETLYRGTLRLQPDHPQALAALQALEERKRTISPNVSESQR